MVRKQCNFNHNALFLEFKFNNSIKYFFACIFIFFLVMHMFSKNYFKLLNSVNIPWEQMKKYNNDVILEGIAPVENKGSFRNHMDKSEIVHIKVEKEKEKETILITENANNQPEKTLEVNSKVENNNENINLSNINNDNLASCSLRGSLLGIYVFSSIFARYICL